MPGFLPGAGKPGPVLHHLPHYGQLHLLPGHQEVLNLRDQGGKDFQQEKRKKKDSPSNRRRNQRRKEESLKRKSGVSSEEAEIVVKEIPEHPKAFKCYQCEMSFNTQKGLKIHKGKSHKCSLLPSPEKRLCSTEKVLEKEVAPAKESTREEEPVEQEEGEEGPPLPVEEPVQIMKEDLEPYKLEFND